MERKRWVPLHVGVALFIGEHDTGVRIDINHHWEIEGEDTEYTVHMPAGSVYVFDDYAEAKAFAEVEYELQPSNNP